MLEEKGIIGGDKKNNVIIFNLTLQHGTHRFIGDARCFDFFVRSSVVDANDLAVFKMCCNKGINFLLNVRF